MVTKLRDKNRETRLPLAYALNSFFVEGGAMNFIEKSVIATNDEFHREKCNLYKRRLASSVPKLSQLRPVIVRWPTLFRPRLGA